MPSCGRRSGHAGRVVRLKFTYLLVAAVDVNAPLTLPCNAPRIQTARLPGFKGLAILAKVVELP
jgi:hypothetical protein